MTDDRAFLDAVRADPADAARWLVYADWLDDHNDPRGEYLRLVQSLATNPDPVRRRRLNAVRPTLPRDWLAEIEQPALMRANPTPYSFFWPGVGLGDLRPDEGTYTGSDYQTLPPVSVEWIVRFEDWLARRADGVEPEDPPPEDEDEDYVLNLALRLEEWQTAVPRLSAAANDFGLKLPDRFVAFLGDERHLYLSAPPTGCTYGLPERIAPAPGCPEAGLIRFYSDSQGVLHWYLYLTPEGDECVVTSDALLGGDSLRRRLAELDGLQYEAGDDTTDRPFWFCAPSFAEFIVRTWLENIAFYSIHAAYPGPAEARGSQAPEVRAYLDHYRRARGQESGVRGQEGIRRWPAVPSVLP